MRLFTSAVTALVLLQGAACTGSREAAPRSPLADTSTPSPAPATLSPTMPGAAATTVTPPGGTPSAVELETAAGLAIEMLAEWLGLAATQLSVLAVEAVTWPNACLGVARPGVACAEVLTPGFRVPVVDALGGEHEVHLGSGGRAVWAGEAVARGTVEAVDAVAGHLTLEVEGAALSLRAAPGTLWDVGPGTRGLAGLAAGDAVVAAYDPSPDGAAPSVIAWLSLDPPQP